MNAWEIRMLDSPVEANRGNAKKTAVIIVV